MKCIKAMQELRATLTKASPVQLAIALEAVAYVHTETFLDHHKPPEGTTPAEHDELRAALIYNTIADALNTAAEVAINLRDKAAAEPQPSAEDQARASAAADSAIAKAAGKLH